MKPPEKIGFMIDNNYLHLKSNRGLEKLKKSIILFSWISLISLPLLSNSSTLSKNPVYWVSGIQMECSSGAGKMQCLSIHRGEDLKPPKWELFYATIHGFTFEEGYLQKIEVNEEQLDLKKVPADASSIKYTLVKVLDKKQDMRWSLAGSWIPEKINDKPITRGAMSPDLTVDLSRMQVSGSDGCNNYKGNIDHVTQSMIEFGKIVSTRKMCRDMTSADVFNTALNNAASYQIKGDNLVLYDEDGKDVASFIKKVESSAHQNLHDIWVAIRIDGGPINRMVATPRME